MAGLIRPGLASLSIKIVSVGLGFALSVLLVRLIGADGYALYAFAFAVVTMLSVPTRFGLPVLVVRETARARQDGAPADILTLWTWAHLVILALSAVVLALFGAGIWLGAGGATLMWGLLLIPLMSLGALRGGCLRGMGRVLAGQLPDGVVRPLALCGLILAVWLAGVSLSAQMAMALHVVAALLAFGVGSVLLWSTRPTGKPPASGAIGLRPDWLRASVTLGAASAVMVVNSNLDIFMAGLLLDDLAQVGHYKVASLAAGLIPLGLVALNQVLQPRIAILHQANRRADLQGQLTGATRLILGFGLLLALPMVAFGETALRHLYGPDLVPAYPILLVLVAAQVVNAFFGSVGLVLNMTGHQGDTLVGVTLALGVNAGLNLLLIPMHGVIGAAWATCGSILVWNLFLWWRVRMRMGFDTTIFGRVVDGGA